MWKTKLRILCFVGSGNWGRGSTGTKKETTGTRKVPGRYRNQVGNGRPFKTFELKTITFPASQFFNLHFLTILKPQFIHIKLQILNQQKTVFGIPYSHYLKHYQVWDFNLSHMVIYYPESIKYILRSKNYHFNDS